MRRARRPPTRRAFDRLKVGDPRATRAFAAHLGRHGSDPLVAFHLKRLLSGKTGTLIPLHDAAE
jgi:hypothetical protein